MREVSVHRDIAIVGFHKSILDQAGIACYIRNEHSSASLGAGAMGLVQSHLFDPVLCIVDDDRFDEAIDLLRGQQSDDSSPQEEWTCPKCSEIVPAGFEVCWNCGGDTQEDSASSTP